MIPLLFSCALIMAASLAGVVALSRTFGRHIERRLELLVSFAAGVFLVFAAQIAAEAVEHSADATSAYIWITAGGVGAWLLFKILPSVHRHEHGHHGHNHLDARRLLLTDGVHNVADGILLAASYAISPALGVAATVSVFAHEILQEIAEFFVLKDAGYSTRRALIINFAASSTILVGAVGGFFLLDQFEMLEGVLLGLVAGAALMVIFGDLIPHALAEAKGVRQYMAHTGWLILGLILMLLVTQAIPHAEPEIQINASDAPLHY